MRRAARGRAFWPRVYNIFVNKQESGGVLGSALCTLPLLCSCPSGLASSSNMYAITRLYFLLSYLNIFLPHVFIISSFLIIVYTD